MLVFISWSGTRSKAVAQALQSWLRQVIQAVKPWLSADIKKGQRWGPEVTGNLEQSRVGIICLTKDNLSAPWILFEAGAISKTKDAHVCTFLLDLAHSDVDYPLAQFQHTKAVKEDIFQLLQTINGQLEKERALADEILRSVFDTNWPALEKAIEAAAALPLEKAGESRSEMEILQEVLELSRNQGRLLSEVHAMEADSRKQAERDRRFQLYYGRPVRRGSADEPQPRVLSLAELGARLRDDSSSHSDSDDEDESSLPR
jgi:hypothetical protein